MIRFSSYVLTHLHFSWLNTMPQDVDQVCKLVRSFCNDSIEPFGAPERTGLAVDVAPKTVTRCFQSDKYDWNHCMQKIARDTE